MKASFSFHLFAQGSGSNTSSNSYCRTIQAVWTVSGVATEQPYLRSMINNLEIDDLVIN